MYGRLPPWTIPAGTKCLHYKQDGRLICSWCDVLCLRANLWRICCTPARSSVHFQTAPWNVFEILCPSGKLDLFAPCETKSHEVSRWPLINVHQKSKWKYRLFNMWQFKWNKERRDETGRLLKEKKNRLVWPAVFIMQEFRGGRGSVADAPKGSWRDAKCEGLYCSIHPLFFFFFLKQARSITPLYQTRGCNLKKQLLQRIARVYSIYYKGSRLRLTWSAWRFCSAQKQRLDKCEHCGAVRWRAVQCRANSGSPAIGQRTQSSDPC